MPWDALPGAAGLGGVGAGAGAGAEAKQGGRRSEAAAEYAMAGPAGRKPSEAFGHRPQVQCDHIGRFEFRRIITDRVVPSLRAFNPDLILISAGFDGGRSDVGNARYERGYGCGLDLLVRGYPSPPPVSYPQALISRPPTPPFGPPLLSRRTFCGPRRCCRGWRTCAATGASCPCWKAGTGTTIASGASSGRPSRATPWPICRASWVMPPSSMCPQGTRRGMPHTPPFGPPAPPPIRHCSGGLLQSRTPCGRGVAGRRGGGAERVRQR